MTVFNPRDQRYGRLERRLAWSLVVMTALALSGWILFILPIVQAGAIQLPSLPVFNLAGSTPTPTATMTPTVTPTMTPSPTATMTPTVTLTPTPTPVVFASEEECDPIPLLEMPDAARFHSSFLDFIYGKGFRPAYGAGYFRVKKENWFTLLTPDTLVPEEARGAYTYGAYALLRAEWEPFLDSNRYCQVGVQWMPLSPYEDFRRLNTYP